MFVRLCVLALAVSTVVLAAENKVTTTSASALQLFLEADANALNTGPGPKVKQSNDLVKSSNCIRCQNGGVPSTDCRKCNCRAPFTGDRCQSKNKGVAFNGHFLDNEFIKSCKVTKKECSDKALRVTEDIPVPALLFVKEASVGKKNWMLQLERLSISLFDFMPPSSMSISATKDQVAKLVKDEDVLLVTKLPPSIKIDQALANGFVAPLPGMQPKHPDSAAPSPSKHHPTPAPGGNTQSVLLSVKFGLLGTVDDPVSPPAPRGAKIVAEINNAIDERNKKLLSESKPILVAEVISHTETTVVVQSHVADAASIAALLSLRPQITSISRLEPFEISTRLHAENLNALYTKALAESLRKRRNAYGHAVGQRGSFDNTDGLAAALGAAGKNYPIFERHLTGKRQVIGVADTGLDYHHCAFSAMEDVNAGVLIVRDIKLRLNAPDDREYDISVKVKPAQSANAKIGAATYSNIVKHTSGSKPASGVSAERHFPVPLHFDVPTNVDLAEFTVTVREVRPDAGGTEDHMVKADDHDITVKRDSNFFGLYLDAIKLSAFATAEGRALAKLEVRNAADTAQYGELDLTLAFRPKPGAKIERYFGAWGDYGDYSGGHGTHVVGSIAGHPPDHGISAKHRGGSPDAAIVFFDLENDRYEDGGSGFIAFEAADVLGKLRASGARIISNSYNGGSDAVQQGGTAPYNGPVGAIDEWIFKHKDTVVLWSAGNQGWNWKAPAGPRARSILHEGNSKNALVVGAAAAPLEAWKERHKYMTSGCGDAFTKLGQDPWKASCSEACTALASAHHAWPAPMADFSGRGPLDGSPNRFKPDIGVTGQFVISPRAGRRGNSDLNGVPEVGNSCTESTNVLVWSAGSTSDHFISTRGVLWNPPTTETYYHFREATPNNRLGKIYFLSSFDAHDLSALDIQIAFEARLAPSPTPHAHGCDKLLLEYSTDGATWITLHEAKPGRDKWSDHLVIIDASNNAGARHATTSLRFNQPCSVPRKEGEQTVSVRRLLISERTGDKMLFTLPSDSLEGTRLVSSSATSTRGILVLQGVQTNSEQPMVFSPDLYLPHGGQLRVEYAFCGDTTRGSLDLHVYPVVWNAARREYIPQRVEVLAPERRWKYSLIKINPSNEPQRIAITQNNNQQASANYERAVCLTASLYADRLDERGLLVDMAGTSMATPVAAGLMGLVRQYYTDGFVPLGKQHFGLGFSPSGALMKGTLMHAANSDPGSATKDQDGFGRPALKDVLAFSSPATDHDLIVRKTDRIFTFNQEGTEHLALRFRAANTADIKASLSYYDIADGANGAIFARLDLKMIQADQPNGRADKEKTPHNAWNPDDNNFKYVQYRPTANNEHHHMVVKLNTLGGKGKPLYKTHPLSYAIVVTGRGLTFEMHTYHVIVQFAAKYRSAVANPPERTCTITVPGSNERHSFLCGEEFNSYNLWTNKPLGSIASITLSYPIPLTGRDDPREVVMHNVFSGTTMVADYCSEDTTNVPQNELQVKCELSSFNKAFRRVADVLTTKLESIYDVTFWSSSEQPDLLVDNDFKVEFRIHDEAHGTYPVKISRRRDLARETVTRLEVRGPPLGNVLADKFFMKIVPNDCVPPPAQWLIRKVRVHDLSTGHLYHAVMETEAAGTINQEGFKQINLVRFVPNRHCYYCIHALMRARTFDQKAMSWSSSYTLNKDRLVAATCSGQTGLAKESCVEVVNGDIIEAFERVTNERAPDFKKAAKALMQVKKGETLDQIKPRAVETCDTLFSGCDAYNNIDVTDLTRLPGDPFNRGQHEVYTAFSAFYR